MTEKTCPTCHRPLPAGAPLCPVCVLMGAREERAPAGVPPLEEIRAAFPQFEILECIGRGGMGIVYKVRQPQLDRLLALKILLPGLKQDPGFAERFAREARALAKLSHANIVAVHDFGESGGFFWLTMEHIDGVNLRQAMQAARFTPAQALAVIPDLCAALQYAHDHGVLHRDIKPENILLDARGRVKVADFGIARMAGDERPEFTLTMTGAALGSTAYIAPEQIENPRNVDHRADLYSLGVVLYEMLTGELPLGRFPAPSERSASDPRLDEVVFKALEKEREKRFQSADEVKAGVETACDRPAPVRKTAAAADSNLVAWSIGLLLAGGTILGIAASAASLLIAAPGACAAVLGIAAGWWVLWRMKKGTIPTGGRTLLLVLFAWLPLLGGSVTLAFLIADHFSPWFGGKGDYLAKMAFVFLATFLPAAGLFHLGALPKGAVRSGRLRRGTAIAAGILALGSLAGGKWLDGRWPVANYRATAYLRLENPASWKRQASAIQDALRAAAGPYAERIEISSGKEPRFGSPAAVIRFIAPDKIQWEAHWKAIVKRLAVTLPAETFVGLDWNLVELQSYHWGKQPDYSFRHFAISSCILIAAALSALLAASALFPLSWTPLLVFLAGTGFMVVTPRVANDIVVDGPPLAPLVPVVAPADFSTPVAAARSVFDAAWAGDLETVKRGISRRNRVFLDNRDGWQLAMEHLGQRAVVSLPGRARSVPNRCSIHREMRGGSGSLDMLFEDGEWRLDDLPFQVPEKP